MSPCVYHPRYKLNVTCWDRSTVTSHCGNACDIRYSKREESSSQSCRTIPNGTRGTPLGELALVLDRIAGFDFVAYSWVNLQVKIR